MGCSIVVRNLSLPIDRAVKTEPDQLLIKMPSLRAVKAFVAAAKCASFSRAAESLCVTPAAVSRQIKELEDFLGTALFSRAGRAVRLTEAGLNFFNVAQLSFMNIAQAADRLRQPDHQRQAFTLCCSPATANLWLAPRLVHFSTLYPDVQLNIITTHDFRAAEAAGPVDVFITQSAHIKDGYQSHQLFGELIYPVCSPTYYSRLSEPLSLAALGNEALLNLSPFGRAALAEFVDWDIWFALHRVKLRDRPVTAANIVNANDYCMLVQMALRDQGIALGWHHLVSDLVKQGSLIRLVGFDIVQPQTFHYLAIREEVADLPAALLFKDWITSLPF